MAAVVEVIQGVIQINTESVGEAGRSLGTLENNFQQLSRVVNSQLANAENNFEEFRRGMATELNTSQQALRAMSEQNENSLQSVENNFRNLEDTVRSEMTQANNSMNNFSNNNKSLSSKISKNLSKLGSNFKNFGAGVNRELKKVGIAIAGFGALTIKLASDAVEIEGKFNAVFKSITEQANKTAESLAKNYGLTSTESKKLLGNTGDLLTGFGYTQEEALKLSNTVNKLAVDLASFTNYSGGTTGASQALTKALLGETEQVKALGVVVRQSTTVYKNRVKELMKLNNLTEQQARTEAILEQILSQSKNAMGDYARTSKEFANQFRLAQGRVSDFAKEIGNKLLPAAKNLITKFNSIDLNKFLSKDNISKLKEYSKGFVGLAITISAVGTAVALVSNPLVQLAALSGIVAGLFAKNFLGLSDVLKSVATNVLNFFIKIDKAVKNLELKQVERELKVIEKAKLSLDKVIAGDTINAMNKKGQYVDMASSSEFDKLAKKINGARKRMGLPSLNKQIKLLKKTFDTGFGLIDVKAFDILRGRTNETIAQFKGTSSEYEKMLKELEKDPGEIIKTNFQSSIGGLKEIMLSGFKSMGDFPGIDEFFKKLEKLWDEAEKKSKESSKKVAENIEKGFAPSSQSSLETTPVVAQGRSFKTNDGGVSKEAVIEKMSVVSVEQNKQQKGPSKTFQVLEKGASLLQGGIMKLVDIFTSALMQTEPIQEFVATVSKIIGDLATEVAPILEPVLHLFITAIEPIANQLSWLAENIIVPLVNFFVEIFRAVGKVFKLIGDIKILGARPFKKLGEIGDGLSKTPFANLEKSADKTAEAMDKVVKSANDLPSGIRLIAKRLAIGFKDQTPILNPISRPILTGESTINLTGVQSLEGVVRRSALAGAEASKNAMYGGK